MRLHLTATALGLLALTIDGALAQAPEPPAPATAAAPEADIKAKIQATQKARDELIQRFEAESAKKGSKDAKRDAELHALSGTICSGCSGAAPSIAPPKRNLPKRSAPKRRPSASDEPPIVDDLR